MTYERFEDLPVWKSAQELAEQIYNLMETMGERKLLSFALRDQLERAALSVSNNIAEGFERGTTPELLMFLYIARGSAGEVRSMLAFLERRDKWREYGEMVRELKILSESCSRQLRAWAEFLQNSPIKGQRHLNDKVRLKNEQSRQTEDFGMT